MLKRERPKIRHDSSQSKIRQHLFDDEIVVASDKKLSFVITVNSLKQSLSTSAESRLQRFNGHGTVSVLAMTLDALNHLLSNAFNSFMFDMFCVLYNVCFV